MDQTEPVPPKHLATLLVFGHEVPVGTMEDLSVQLELFFEAIDRAMSQGRSPEFSWRTKDLEFRGQRIQVMPELTGQQGDEHYATEVLQVARRGISYLRRHAKKPPGFSDDAVQHFSEIADVLGHPNVDRVVIHLDQQSEAITRRTLANVRWLTTT